MGLTDLFDGLAEISKLTIIAYEDEGFNTATGEEFVVMYNPTTFSQNFRSNWVDESPKGSTAGSLSFSGISSDNVSFEFLFDGTGVSGVGGTAIDLNADVAEEGYVQEQIDAFFEITQTVNSSTHKPNYLILNWGTFVFQGVMISATVTHKLFHSSGAPIRSIINATFKETVALEEQAAEARRQSPDMTHFRLVNEGESLPLIAKKVYGDAALYLEIARVNNLNNFRKLKTGQRLILPPIKKIENG